MRGRERRAAPRGDAGLLEAHLELVPAEQLAAAAGEELLPVVLADRVQLLPRRRAAGAQLVLEVVQHGVHFHHRLAPEALADHLPTS